MGTEQIRPAAPLYPFPEAGAPDVDTAIDPDLTRKGSALYAFPTTDEQPDNTVGLIIIYGIPA